MAKSPDNSFYMGNKNLPTRDSQHEYTPERLQELKLCAKSILHFAETYFYIVDLKKGKILIQLRKYQKRILKSWKDNRFNVLLSSRQLGKSTLLTIFALWQICFNPDQRVLLIANKEATAINIFKRVRLAYELCPNWLKPAVVEYAKTGMTLANGSSISVSSTSSDSARGESCNVLMIDEAAFIDPSIIEEFWASVMPVITASDESKILIASTPNGIDNKFYEIFSGAEEGDNEWSAQKVDWWELDGRDEAWKEKMIKTLGSEEVFNQEYGNVFKQRGESGFDPGLMTELKANTRAPSWIYDNGDYRVWEKPQEGHIYSIGADVAEGVGRAASVLNIVDITDLTEIKLVAQYHSRAIDTAHFAKKIVEIAAQWGSPPLLIERNNCGMAVIDGLMNTHEYSNIVTFIPKAGASSESFKVAGRTGIFSHTNTKFIGTNNMRYWLETLRVVRIPDEETIKEMETFIRHPNGVWKKRNGKDIYDDRVDSLIWTLLILDPTVATGYFDIDGFDDQGRPVKVIPSTETTPLVDPDRVYISDNAIAPMPKNHTPPMPTYIKPNLSNDAWHDLERFDGFDDGAWYSAESFYQRSAKY